ncbi:MAG: hypothetical protein ACRC45_03320, partial [Cetobacterium sp.]
GISFILGQIIIMNVYYKVIIGLDIVNFWKNILKMSFPIVIAMAFGIVLNRYLKEISYLKFVIKTGLYTVVYSGLLWKLGLNEYEKSQIPISKIFNKIKK